MSTDTETATRHLRACERFTRAVDSADGKWGHPSPCEEWSARDLVEHVIGFHDVLLLRPMGAKPQRPKEDPAQRWALTNDALRELFARPGLFEGPVDVPAVGNNPPTKLDATSLVRALTQDVLVHTWDLARAVGADSGLDSDTCEYFISRLPTHPNALVSSGMFERPLDVPQDAEPQRRLLARLGRDPDWRPQDTATS